MREDGGSMSATPKKSWKWGCAGVVVICAVLAYGQWFFSGYVPVSILPVETHPELNVSKYDTLCRELPFPLPYPYSSLDGKYYVDKIRSRYRNAEVLRLFEAKTNRFLGSYSYHEVLVYCWANDSSGIYLADYVDTGGAGLFIGIPQLGPGGGGDVKKVLVPCRGSLEGVPLLPRWFWGIRCRISGR